MPQRQPSYKTVCECGHRPVSHRYGPCEAVERTGWLPAHKRFSKEVPCTCTKYRQAKREKDE